MYSFFRSIGKLISSLLLIFISLFLAIFIGAEMLETPCPEGIDCSVGPNDFAIGIVIMIYVFWPSVIWLCLGELYVFLKKRTWHSRLLMLLFPSIYTVLIISTFL